MDMIIAAIIGGLFVAAPLVLRANMLTVLGALAFGWVLNDVTGNELLLFSRSLMPTAGDSERFALLLFSFLPALAAVMLTKKSAKNSMLAALHVLLAPAIFVIAWHLVRGSLPLSQARELAEGTVSDLVSNNQEYAIWAAAVVLLMSMFFTRNQPALKPKSKKG